MYDEQDDSPYGWKNLLKKGRLHRYTAV